ncbi:MAG: hypothetical protein V4654_11655 [Bdellovibrionota bacterium]
MVKIDSKWTLPSLHKITSVKDLFIQLQEVNKKHKSFSYRALSLRLKWPVGYIPDLIKERRKLTIKRCMQLSIFFAADPIDTERIILLSLREYSDKEKNYFSQRLTARSNEDFKPTQDFSLLQVSYQLIQECLRWYKKPMTLQQLQFTLQRCQFSKEEMERALNILVERKIIRKKGQSYSCDKGTNISQDLGLNADFFYIHQAYADNFKKLINPPVTPGFLSTNYLFLHPEKIMEIRDKLFSFRTWLRNMSETDLQKPSSKELLLFQFDLNLSPVFGKEIASSILSQD